ncbi:MAG: hydroxylamine oxidoreductase [Desulfarculus sp.]|nr:MAG: hydroxylamine oxidoreductase [Desulfarculus sp.]
MRKSLLWLGAAALLALAWGLTPGPAQAQKPVPAPNQPLQKEFRIVRSMSKQAVACIQCHKLVSPGIFSDWAHSRHASANITCLDCHKAEEFDPDVAKEHYKVYEKGDNPWAKAAYRVPISGVVTPKDCSRCHPDEAKQYSVSKHANTLQIIWQIDPWLNFGLNSDFERTNGCFTCHGTVLKVDKNGKLDPQTWPNVGVGRLNLDGSRGSCSACHTRHRFSVAEARKPDTCGQCHLGPDHPQWEIYNESKHGSIMRSQGEKWNWNAAPGTWTPGVDYRTPTCAACHMSGSGVELTTHDVTRRLSWEMQAPLTIRPQDFKPWPSQTSWQEERTRMRNICLQCHSQAWADSHFTQMDGAVKEYNNVYYQPALKKLDELYKKGLLPKDAFFKAPLWVQFYELWHHEGRRARMGAAMMAPDYSWWHGFYECKKRYLEFMREADELIKHHQKAYVAPYFPAATGSTQKPPQIFGPRKK